jgi:hypothetical protein
VQRRQAPFWRLRYQAGHDARGTTYLLAGLGQWPRARQRLPLCGQGLSLQSKVVNAMPILILLGVLLSGDNRWEPFESTPPAWTWVALPPTDSVRGVYHDSLSGAFVQVDIVEASGGEPSFDVAGGGATPRREHGALSANVTYDLATYPDARAAIGHILGRTPKAPARDLPPDGCSLLAATFHIEQGTTRPRSAHFWSATCDALQRERVRRLLLTRRNFRPLEWPRQDRGLPQELDVQKGDKLRDILARKGWPFDCWRAGMSGVVLVFPLTEYRAAELRFDRTQRLVEIRYVDGK